MRWPGSGEKLSLVTTPISCVLRRAVPMVEAMALLVLADHWLRQQAVDVLPPLTERP